MLDRYDPRSNDGRDRGNSWDRNVGSRGGAGEREHDERSRDVFTRDLDLPRGRDWEQVRDRDRVYAIDGDESRTLATVGAFRVVAESDLHDIRENSQSSRRSLKHLKNEGLIRSSPLSSDDRAVVLTERGRDLLEANRFPREERSWEPRQTFYAGLRKPRELTHDTPGLSRLPARRGTTQGSRRTGPSSRPRLRTQARLSAIPPRAQPRPEGLRWPAGS